jgi:hypothetical protein
LPRIVLAALRQRMVALAARVGLAQPLVLSLDVPHRSVSHLD